ncbi:MAG: hypothetical protein M3Y85_03255, partial [Bacteroidota bacterium]|nr:hypothetical protein [Bacteroidota bacterium]
MKRKLLMVFGLALFFSASAQDMKDMPGMKMPIPRKETKKIVARKTVAKLSSKRVLQKTIYTCPMHPEVQLDEPGNCPQCGMTLVKKTVKTSPPKSAVKKDEGMKMPAKDTAMTRNMKDMKMDDKKDMNMDNMKGMN